MKNQREEFIDIAKGISIILMTITHLQFLKKYDVVEYINYEYLILFKMPMFIIISGYLFSTKNKLNDFFVSKLDSLIKPAVTVLISFVILINLASLAGLISSRSWIEIFQSFLPLWFVFSLFFSLIIFRFLFHIFEKNSWSKSFLLTALVIVVLWYANELDVRYSIFNFSTLIYFLMYLLIGYLLKKKNLINTIVDSKSSVILILIFSTSILSQNFFDVKVRLFSNVYDPFILCFIYSVCGGLMIISISSYLSNFYKLKNALKKCGECSFFILAFHSLIGNSILGAVVRHLKLDNIFVDFLSFVLTIYICVVLRDLSYRLRYFKLFLFPKKIVV